MDTAHRLKMSHFEQEREGSKKTVHDASTETHRKSSHDWTTYGRNSRQNDFHFGMEATCTIAHQPRYVIHGFPSINGSLHALKDQTLTYLCLSSWHCSLMAFTHSWSISQEKHSNVAETMVGMEIKLELASSGGHNMWNLQLSAVR